MMPTGLFVDAPEMNDPSLTQMSSEAQEWPEEIVSKLKERIPEVNGMNIIVKFMKQNDENGVATGSAVVGNASKQIIIPVIMKDFMLYPLDIMIADKKLLPLTPDYFKAVFSKDMTLFKTLMEYPTFSGLGRFDDGNLWSATYPPSLGRYAYASANFQMVSDIAETITEKDLAEFKKSATDMNVISNFHKHDHLDAIKKIANLQPVNMNEFRQGADNLLKKDIFMLRKEGPNKYSILSNSSSVFNPMLEFMNKDQFSERASKISDNVEDTVNDVDQNGEKLIITAPETGEAPYLRNEFLNAPKVVQANEFDHYIVKDKSGIEFEGMVVPYVINFRMDVTPLKLFLGKTMSTIQNEIAGVRVENSRWQMKPHDPTVGQTGTFYWQSKDNKSKCLATVPVTIKSISEDGMGKLITVVDMHGVTLRLKFCRDKYERIVPPLEDGGSYVMPEGFNWYPMEGFKEISNSPVDYAVKIAYQLSGNSITIQSNGYGEYGVKGLNKYAEECGWDPSQLKGYQLKFLLGSLGSTNEKTAQFIKKANQSVKADVHGLKSVPTKREKVSAAIPQAQKLFKVASGLKCNLIKEASFMDNSQTIDTLLSLNFINPENITKFVGKLSQLKSTISSLASLIIASRLGMREIPEEAASTAMHRLMDVVSGLEALRSAQEGNT